MTSAASTEAMAAPHAGEPATAPRQPTEMHKYMFDLRGYVLLKDALDAEHVARINAALDAYASMDPPLKPGEWIGGVHAHTYTGNEGLNLQQIYEAGEPFERLIDHPSYIEIVRCFVGGEGTFDYHHGPLFIDENFASIRGPGDAIGLHSGGDLRSKRGQFRFHNGRFHCGQVNALIALTDIGPGDGGTMIVPGSHKSNLQHPQMTEKSMKGGACRSVDGVEAAVEVFMNAGDVLVFVDAIAHGSAKRVNPGQRRIIVYRYGPSWGTFRHPYQPTRQLLDRLTPQRRQIVMPHHVTPRTPNRVPGFSEA